MAMAALLIEGVVVAPNRGDCPFGCLSAKYGDTKTFFELSLPKTIAKQMFRIKGVLFVAG